MTVMGGGWMTVTVQADLTTHVIPMNDLREHHRHGECWCHPVVEHESRMMVHNSADGREDFEEGRRKPS